MKAKTDNGGFTLTELVVAVFIFGMVIAALVAIYGTSHRHMMQNFRENVIKNSLSVAFKAIQQDLSTATRIDSPAPGLAGNSLGYARNISSDRCYPIKSGIPAQWGHVCVTGGKLYHHKGTVGGGPGCPATAGLWPVSYPACGAGGLSTLLLKDVVCTGGCFKRNSTEGESEQVRIQLTVRRPATTVSREIKATLDTVIKVNMANP